MKAGSFAVGSAKIEQIKANCSEKEIWRPGRDPGRDAVTFAEREKKLDEEVHRENEDHRSRNAREHAPARVSDSERGRDTNHYQARPRQGETILEMSAERRKQSSRKIRIETQILP